MEYLLHEGRVLKVPRIDRGPRIVDTEDQWRARQVRAASKISAFLSATLFVELVAVLLMVRPHVPSEEGEFVGALVRLSVPVILFCLIMPYAVYALSVRKNPVMAGVYGSGIQIPGLGGALMGNVFIPFDQVIGFRKARLFGPPGTVWLDLRGVWYPIRMFSWVFGREGIEAVRQVIAARHAAPAPSGPPRLVLYGP